MRAARSVIAAVAVVAVVLLCAPSRVLAHAALESSVPAANSAPVDGTGDDLIAEASEAHESSESLRWAYGAARFLSVLAALALVGVGGWLLIAAAVGERASTYRVLRVACVVFVFGALATFGLFAANATGGGLADAMNPSGWRRAADIDTGRALLARSVLAVALLALAFTWARRTRAWWRATAVVMAASTIATFPLAGHPRSLRPLVLWVAIDFVHLVAIAVWIGGLCALLISGREVLATHGDRLARRFSRASAVCVPIIVATGAVQAWKLAGGLDDVGATRWGQVLLVKVTLVVFLLASAAVSRWLLLNDGVASIRRTVLAEAAIAVAVFGLSAGMVGLSPTPVSAARPFATQLASGGVIVEVTLGPGVVGSNEIHVIVTPQGGSIVPVVAAAVRVSLEEVVPSAPVQLTSEGTNHYSGFVTFPRSGDWTVDVIVEVTAGNTVLLTTTVPIP